MQKRCVALYTFGVFRYPSAEPVNQGFHDRNDPNFRAVEESSGFIARSGYADEPGPESWGVQVFPRFYVERGDGWSPSTLSLWQDLVSPMAFAYFGLHAESLKLGREWFERPQWPPYVLWWVEPGHVPSWQEAITRHEHLHDHGASAFAFDFKQAYDEVGEAAVVDRAVMKAIVEENAGRRSRASTGG